MSSVSPSASAALADSAATSRPKLRFLLSLMMFLEYAVWGAWMPVLSATLINRQVPGDQVGNIYGMLWLGCALTPFLGGQIADRVMPGQVFLAISHFLAAGAAFWMASQGNSTGYLWGMLIWALLFAPSLGVTNAIALRHIDGAGLPERLREREFAWVRAAGTAGWIVSAFLLAPFTASFKLDPTGKTGPIPEMMLTGALGIIMAVYSFFLPNTPPSRQNTDPFAFRRAFSMFKTVPGFAVFMIISFIAATEFQFFYVLSGPFLEAGQTFTKIPHELVGPVKSISQAAEFIALGVLLPLWLPKKGMRWCLLLGSFAWPIRYVIFAIGQPTWLVLASLALHGFGYAFVIVAQQLYVDRVAPKDIRSSAQNLLNLITLGFGNFLGSLFCGQVLAHYTDTATNTVNWVPVFVLPAITTSICAFAYMFTFRTPDTEEPVSTAGLSASH